MPATNTPDYGQLLKNLLDQNMSNLAKSFGLTSDDFRGVDARVTEDTNSRDQRMGKAYDVVLRAPVPMTGGRDTSEFGMKVRIAAGGSGSGNNIVVSMPGAIGPDGSAGSTIVVGDMVIGPNSELRTPTGAPNNAPASTGIESAATRLVYGMFHYMTAGDEKSKLQDYVGPAINSPIINPEAGIFLPGQSRYLGQNTSDAMWRSVGASRNLYYINDQRGGYVDMSERFDRLISNINSSKDASLLPFQNGIVKNSGDSRTFMLPSYFGTSTVDRTGQPSVAYRGVLKGYLAEQRDRADPFVWNQKSGSVVPLGQYIDQKGISGFYQQAGAVKNAEEIPHPGVISKAVFPVYGMLNASGTALTDLPSDIKARLQKEKSSLVYGYQSSERFEIPVRRGDDIHYQPNKVDLLQAIRGMNVQFDELQTGKLFQPGRSSVVLGMDAPDGSRINQAVKSKRPMAITGRTLVLPSSLITDSASDKFPTLIPQEQQSSIANEFREALGMGMNDNVTFDPKERGIGVVVQKQEFGPSAIKSGGKKLFPSIPLLGDTKLGIYDQGKNGLALRQEAQIVGEGKQLGAIFQNAFGADPKTMLGVTERAFNLQANSLASGLGNKSTPWLTSGGQVNISALGQQVAGMIGARTDGMRLVASPSDAEMNKYFVGEGQNPLRARDYMIGKGLSKLSEITEPLFERDPEPGFDTPEGFTAILGSKIVGQGVNGGIYSEFGIGLTEGWLPQGNVTGSTREHLAEDLARSLSQPEYWADDIPSDLSGLSAEDKAFYQELTKVRGMDQTGRIAYMRDYANRLVANNAEGHPLGSRIRVEQNANVDINDDISYTIFQKSKMVAAPSIEYRNPEYEGTAAEISSQELDTINQVDPRMAARLEQMKKVRSFDENVPVSRQASRAKLNVLSMAKSLSLNNANKEAFGTVMPDPIGGSHMIAGQEDVQRLIRMQEEYQGAPHDMLIAMGKERRIGRNKGIFLPKTGIALPSPSLVAENEQMAQGYDAKTGEKYVESISQESIVYNRHLKNALELEAARGRGDVVTEKQIQNVKTGLSFDLLMKKGDGENVNKDEIDMGISGRYNSSPLVPQGAIFFPNSVIRSLATRAEPGLISALKEMDPNAELAPGESAYKALVNRLSGQSALVIRDPNSNPSNVDENGNTVLGSMYEMSILTSKSGIGKQLQRQINRSGAGIQGVTIHPDTTMSGDLDADPLRAFILSMLGTEKIPEGEEYAGKYRFALNTYNHEWADKDDEFIGSTVGRRMDALGNDPIPQTFEALTGMLRQVKVRSSEEISEADAVLGGMNRLSPLLTKMPKRSTPDETTLASSASEYNESKNNYMGSIYNTYLRKMKASGIAQGVGLDVLGHLSNQFAGYYQKALDLELPENSPLSNILNTAVIKKGKGGNIGLSWKSKSVINGEDGNPKIIEGWKHASFGANRNPFDSLMVSAIQSIGSDEYASDREGVDKYVSPSALSTLMTTIPEHQVFETDKEQKQELIRMNDAFITSRNENTAFLEQGLVGITDPKTRNEQLRILTEKLIGQGKAGGNTILTGMLKSEMLGRMQSPKTAKQRETAPSLDDLQGVKVFNRGIETTVDQEFANVPLIQHLTNSMLKRTKNQYDTNESNDYRDIDNAVEAVRIAKSQGLQVHSGIKRMIENSDVSGLITVDSKGNSANLVSGDPTLLQAIMEDQASSAKAQLDAEKAQEAKEQATTDKKWGPTGKGRNSVTPPGGGGSNGGNTGQGGSINDGADGGRGGDGGGGNGGRGILGSSGEISDFLTRMERAVSSGVISGNVEYNKIRSETYRSELLPGSRPEEKEQAKLVLSNLLSQNEMMGKTFDHAPSVMQNNPRIPRDLRNDFAGQDFLNSVISVTEGLGTENQAKAFANNPELIAQAKAFKRTTSRLHNLVGKSSFSQWSQTLTGLYPDMDQSQLRELTMTSYGLGGGQEYLNIDENPNLDEGQKERMKKAFAAKAAIGLIDLGNAKDKSLSDSDIMGMQNDYVGKGKLGKIRAMEAKYGRKFLTGEAQEIKNRIIGREHSISDSFTELQTAFDGIVDINPGTSDQELHNLAFDGIDQKPGESDEDYNKRKTAIFELRKDPDVQKAFANIHDNRIGNDYDRNLLQANYSPEKLQRNSADLRFDAEAASAMSRNIKEFTASVSSIRNATIEYAKAMSEVSNKTKDFGKVLSDVTEKTSGSVTIDGQQVAMKYLTPDQYLKLDLVQRYAVQSAGRESGVDQNTIDSLNIGQTQIEELQGNADAKFEKVQNAKSEISIPGITRKLLGGFGLMYARSIIGMIGGGLDKGYQQGLQSEELMSQSFGSDTGAGYIANNPETIINNKLAGVGGSGMLGLRSLQAAWTNPTTSMLSGAAQAGIATFGGATYVVPEVSKLFGKTMTDAEIGPMALKAGLTAGGLVFAGNVAGALVNESGTAVSMTGNRDWKNFLSNIPGTAASMLDQIPFLGGDSSITKRTDQLNLVLGMTGDKTFDERTQRIYFGGQLDKTGTNNSFRESIKAAFGDITLSERSSVLGEYTQAFLKEHPEIPQEAGARAISLRDKYDLTGGDETVLGLAQQYIGGIDPEKMAESYGSVTGGNWFEQEKRKQEYISKYQSGRDIKETEATARGLSIANASGAAKEYLFKDWGDEAFTYIGRNMTDNQAEIYAKQAQTWNSAKQIGWDTPEPSLLTTPVTEEQYHRRMANANMVDTAVNSFNQIQSSMFGRMSYDESNAYLQGKFTGLDVQQRIGISQPLSQLMSGVNQIQTNAQLYGGMNVDQATSYANTFQNQTMAQISLANQTLQQSGSYQQSLLGLGLGGDQAQMMGTVFTNQSAQVRNNLLSRTNVAGSVANNMVSLWGANSTDAQKFGMEVGGMSQYRQSIYAGVSQFDAGSMNQMIEMGLSMPGQGRLPFYMTTGEIGETGYLKGKLTGNALFTNSMGIGNPGGFTTDPVTGQQVATGLTGAQVASSIFGSDWASNSTINSMVNGITLDGVNSPITGAPVQLRGLSALNYTQALRGYQQQQVSIQQQQTGMNMNYAFTTGVGLGNYNTINPQTGQPFQLAAGGMWGVQDASMYLNWNQQEWSLTQQQRQMNMQTSQFYENMATQKKGTEINKEYTLQNWNFQDETRDLQWSWKKEDYAENIRFMTGRQRKLAERQMKRDTTMHGIEDEQIDSQRSQQKENWELEDERFAIQKKQFEEQKKQQQESLEKQREFFEERKTQEVAQRDLQRAMWVEQMALQQQSIQIQADYAAQNFELQKITIGLQQAQAEYIAQTREAQRAIQDEANTTTQSAWNLWTTTGEAIVLLTQKAIELKETVNSISVGTSYTSARATGGRFAAYEDMLVGENGPEKVTFDRSGSITPGDSWNPWNQSILNSEPSSNNGDKQMTLVINVGNQHLKTFVVDQMSREIDV